jgi:hypothetical protein
LAGRGAGGEKILQLLDFVVDLDRPAPGLRDEAGDHLGVQLVGLGRRPESPAQRLDPRRVGPSGLHPGLDERPHHAPLQPGGRFDARQHRPAEPAQPIDQIGPP